MKRTAKPRGKTGAAKTDTRPLEVRYREAYERVTEPDGYGGRRYRIGHKGPDGQYTPGYTAEDWAAYVSVSKEWDTPAEREKRDEMTYDDSDADFIRGAFEGALTGPARWLYESLTGRERRRVAGLYREGLYDFGEGLERVERDAERMARDWADSLPAAELEAASRKEFEECITRGEVIGEEWKDGIKTEHRGRPSVRAYDVTFYHWEKLVAEMGLVLDGEGEYARYYPPEVYAALVAERQREAEAEKREAAKQAERECAEQMGRAAIAAYVAVHGGAAPGGAAAVAPVAVAPAPVAPAEAQPSEKRKRGRPKGRTPDGREKARAFVEIIEYAAAHGELSIPGAAIACAESHPGEQAYKDLANYENLKKWAQRNTTPRRTVTELIGICATSPQDWDRVKSELLK